MANSLTNSNACGEDVCCFTLDVSIETFLKLAEAVGWSASTAVPA